MRGVFNSLTAHFLHLSNNLQVLFSDYFVVGGGGFALSPVVPCLHRLYPSGPARLSDPGRRGPRPGADHQTPQSPNGARRLAACLADVHFPCLWSSPGTQEANPKCFNPPLLQFVNYSKDNAGRRHPPHRRGTPTSREVWILSRAFRCFPLPW